MNPTWNVANIKLIDWNIDDSNEYAKDIVKILRRPDPGIRIDTN